MLPSYWALKAMWRPSGEKWGSVSWPWKVVSPMASPPARGTIHRSLAYANAMCVALMVGWRTRRVGSCAAVGEGVVARASAAKAAKAVRAVAVVSAAVVSAVTVVSAAVVSAVGCRRASLVSENVVEVTLGPPRVLNVVATVRTWAAGLRRRCAPSCRPSRIQILKVSQGDAGGQWGSGGSQEWVGWGRSGSTLAG